MTYYKSRLPASNVNPAWSTDTEFQDKLLAAVASQGISLDDGQGRELRKIVDEYVFSWQDEQSTETVDAGREILGRLRNSAREFQNVLNEDGFSVRRSEVNDLIEKFLAERNNFELRRVSAGPPDIDPCALQPRISVIADLLGDFVAGCDYADAALKGYEGKRFFRPGEAWDDFMCALAKYYQGELRRNVHASKRGKASAFPRFAFAIQCTLPKRFWNHSEDSAKDPPAEGDPPQAFSHAVDKVLRQHNLRRPSKGPR